jgi:magnesium transporter
VIRSQLFRADQPPTDVPEEEWTTLRQDDGNTLWVDLESPSPEDLDRVATLLELDPRAVALAREPNRQPTVRFYETQLLVTSLAVDVDESQERPRSRIAELDALVSRNCLVTLHDRPLPFAEELAERTTANRRLGRRDAVYLLYVVLDTQVNHYARQLDEIELRVERLEDQLLRDPGRASLGEALVVKRHIQRVRRQIGPHREALAALVGADSPIDEQQVEDYFRDVLARLGTVVERLDHLRDTVTVAHSLYVSNVSHRTNQQLRVLTYLSAVLLPVSAISGLFGTNFKLGDYDRSEPFYVMLGGIALIVAGMLIFFRRRAWL